MRTEDQARSASRGELPPRPRPVHPHCRRSNASRRRCPRRGARQQLHPGRSFSPPMRTWSMAWSFTQRQCRQNTSIQPITSAALRTADPNIMRRGTKACSRRVGSRASSSFTNSNSSITWAKSSRAWAACHRVKRSGSRSVGMAAVTNPGVVKGRFTASAPTLRANVAETGGTRPAPSARF